MKIIIKLCKHQLENNEVPFKIRTYVNKKHAGILWKSIKKQQKSVENGLSDPLQRPCKDPAKGAERSKTAQGRPRPPQEPPVTTKMHLWGCLGALLRRFGRVFERRKGVLGRLRGPKIEAKWWQIALRKGIGNGFRIWYRFSNNCWWCSDFVAMVNCWNYNVKMRWFWTFALSFHKMRRSKHISENHLKTVPKSTQIWSKWSPERIRSALAKRNGR